MELYRYFMRLAFDGSKYHGWQIQENAVTVQEVTTRALETLLSADDILLTGCGRTDTGVHAVEFYAHFELQNNISQEDLDQLSFSLNKFLPQDISIHKIFKVSREMHARFSAISRTYKYFIHTLKDPFLHKYSWYLYGKLDLDLMNEGSMILMEYKDYTSFARLHSQTRTNDCNVTHVDWSREAKKIVFTIIADRFLRNMVRAIAGTMIDLGQHKISLGDFREIIESKDRSEAGTSAPAKGLFLHKVSYPD